MSEPRNLLILVGSPRRARNSAMLAKAMERAQNGNSRLNWRIALVPAALTVIGSGLSWRQIPVWKDGLKSR